MQLKLKGSKKQNQTNKQTWTKNNLREAEEKEEHKERRRRNVYQALWKYKDTPSQWQLRNPVNDTGTCPWLIFFHGYIWKWSSKAKEMIQDESNSTRHSWIWDLNEDFVCKPEAARAGWGSSRGTALFLDAEMDVHASKEHSVVCFFIQLTISRSGRKKEKNIYLFSRLTRNVHRMVDNWLTDVVKYFCSVV